MRLMLITELSGEMTIEVPSPRDPLEAQYSLAVEEFVAIFGPLKPKFIHPPGTKELVEIEPQVRVVTEPGGIVLFAGVQMRSTVPNTSGRSRFSMDFRTVNVDDLVAGRAAPNIDSSPEGTSLRDFLRGSNGAALPEELVADYDSGVPENGVLVFTPETV